MSDNRSSGAGVIRSTRLRFSRSIETLESRIAPAFTAALVGSTVTFQGDDSAENFTLSVDGANLSHGRFSLGEPGFESDTDFDSTQPGVQVLPNDLTVTVVVNLGAGNDVFQAGSAVLCPLIVNGGFGNDSIAGGAGADQLRGGPGKDTLAGGRGNDKLSGGDGNDVFIWNPGDASDTIEGGGGRDALNFNGANISEIFNLAASGSRVQLTRDVASIVMNIGTVEELNLTVLGGSDTINIGNLAGTAMSSVKLHLGSAGGGDGALDRITVEGTGFNDDVRLFSTEPGIAIRGIAARVTIDGADTTDQLSVNGGAGMDNVAAGPGVSSQMALTLAGEFSDPSLPRYLLSAPSLLDAGKSPGSVVAGPLLANSPGPGNDLVVVNTAGNSVSVFLHDGVGGFGAVTTLQTGGKAPKSAVIADFNLDGLNDLAVTNSRSGTISIFLNTAEGVFAAPKIIPVGKTPGVLRTFDANGDGIPDLVTTVAGNKLAVVNGDGTGDFLRPATLIPVGGSKPVDILPADFDGDGFTDLAVACAGSHSVAVLHGNATGGFDAPARVEVGSRPAALASGDFNGDGRADLAVANAGSGFLNILLSTGTGADFALTPVSKISLGTKFSSSGIAAGDLDGDGRDDLVVASGTSGSVRVLLNGGALAFVPLASIDLDNLPARRIASLALADVDGDGFLDILTANAGTNDLARITHVSAVS